MLPKIRKELPEIISRQVERVFLTMFNVRIERADRLAGSYNDDDLISTVTFSQGETKIILRIGVPRMFLSSLLQKIYGPVIGSHEMTYEDSVCEITNIVGNAVKKHLNEHGYSFVMSIPKIDFDFHTRYEKGSDDHMELEFVFNGERLSVDMITFYRGIFEGDEVFI